MTRTTYSHPTINDKEIIQMVARKPGIHQTNEYYRTKAKHEYNREISSSTVVKALGSLKNRLTNSERDLLIVAKQYLSNCNHDVGLANYMITKAQFS